MDIVKHLKQKQQSRDALEKALLKEHGSVVFSAERTDKTYAYMTVGSFEIAVSVSDLPDCEGETILEMHPDIMEIFAL